MYNKRKLLVLSVAVILTVLVVFGFIFYLKRSGKNVPLINFFGSDAGETTGGKEVAPPAPPKVFIKLPEITDDADNDGVSDTREKELGTSNETYDSDGDLLSDRMEIEFYSTDPLKADTDGDGFSDGLEVAEGFNPLGEGVLE